MPKKVKVHNLNFELMMDESEIQQIVERLGTKISQDYADKTPLLLGVLNGSFVFAADLVRNMFIHCDIEFVKLASYDGLSSSGKVSTMIGIDEQKLKYRDIIVVEDIIDTGKTLHHFLTELKKIKPASIALASFLVKPEALQYPMDIDYCGKEIPDKFVVGYGLDYDGLGRNLTGIYQVMDDPA